MNLNFKYFQAPLTEAWGYKDDVECTICGETRACIPDAPFQNKDYRCLICLKNRKWCKSAIESQIGLIYKDRFELCDYGNYPPYKESPPPPGYSREQFDELLHTPPYEIWQEFIHPVCHNDHYIYHGMINHKTINRLSNKPKDFLSKVLTTEDFDYYSSQILNGDDLGIKLLYFKCSKCDNTKYVVDAD